MALLDTISMTILLGALMVLAGIISSLVALRFGAPLLLVFLVVGMLAGEAGPGGIRFDDVRATYLVGSVALAVILFDGGLRLRPQSLGNVMMPAAILASCGVVLTAALTAPIAKFALGIGWAESLLVGAVVASTDAAAVLFLIHARGLRLRPRVGAILEIESGTNDPLAIFLTIILVELLLVGRRPWSEILTMLVQQAALGAVLGLLGGRAIVATLNRLDFPQGLHGPFVTMAALVVFGLAASLHASGFLAVYLAGLVVANRPTRAHNTVIVFLDAVTWLAQIIMFVLLGLLVWPERLKSTLLPALLIALGLMFVARPATVFACLWPFGFSWREKLFISWVGLRGAVGIFLASIPLLTGLADARVYFDVAFVVVVMSLLVQGWSIAAVGRRLDVAFPRADPAVRRVELDLPGQLSQELVGYAVESNSPYIRRGIIPSWAKPTLVIRDQRVLTAAEAGPVRYGDYVYMLAPPEKAQALDRFFVDMPPPASPDGRLLGDFFVPADVTLGALAEIYGLRITPSDAHINLADLFAGRLQRHVRPGDALQLEPIALIAHKVAHGRVLVVGLRLAESDADPVRRSSLPIRLGRALWNLLQEFFRSSAPDTTIDTPRRPHRSVGP